MEEKIKISLMTYAFVTAFSGYLFLSIIIGTFKKTNNLNSKKIKAVLRFGLSGVLACLWIWCFIYMNLYPISLAYYEYNHDFTEEKTGVIDTIERSAKDRIIINIDNTEYTMVYSTDYIRYQTVYSGGSPAIIIGRDIGEGDTVIIQCGIKSKYIFDIYELILSPS